MERDSLILYAKIEALFFQVYPTFKNYPKAEKHGLCLQMKQCFIDLLCRQRELPALRARGLSAHPAHPLHFQ